jgi:hypothetical protein
LSCLSGTILDMALFALFILIAFVALFFIFHDFASSFWGVVTIFVLAWLLWYATGGVERFERSNQGIFIRPTKDYKSFETYGEFPKVPGFSSTTQP